MINEVVRRFVRELGWPRTYNYWAGSTWLTGQIPITAEEAVKLISMGKIIGVWQCYGSSITNPCEYRDVLVFEFDVRECEGNEGIDCIRNWALGHASELMPLLDRNPTIWWNGGKSLYLIYLFNTPVPANYGLRPEWVEYARAIGVDMQVVNAKHAFRLPGTPHQRTGYLGKFLDERLNVVERPIIERVNPFVFMTPNGVRVNTEPVRRPIGERRPKQLPRWVQALIGYLRENGELCHEARRAIAMWMLFLGYSEDEVVEVFKAANDFDEHRTRYYIRYDYENWIARGLPPLSCRDVVEKCRGDDMPEVTCPQRRGDGA